ncbi:hypothetical protein AY608_09495 [Acinetobacter terrae]|nr:hypothetical protein AY608_09495 [Acinetobacter terrae]
MASAAIWGADHCHGSYFLKETFVIFNLYLNAEVLKIFLNDESIENIQLLLNLFLYQLIFIR